MAGPVDAGQYGDLARWYDPLYAAAGKDFASEAQALLEVVRGLGVVPGSLLDVACGTGQHLATFRTRIDDVAGVDVAPRMLEVARERLGPDVPLRHADMRRFDLGRTFDVVTCLFSAIGHVRDEGDLDAAVAAMARHVAPGGVLLVEPWLRPEQVRDEADTPAGLHLLDHATTADGVVARAARSVRRGDVLVLEFAWSVADADGARVARESFRMPLFTRERYLAAVERAGLTASWRDDLDVLQADRGLLVGTRAADG